MRRLSLTNKTEGAGLGFLITGQIFLLSGMVASPSLISSGASMED